MPRDSIQYEAYTIAWWWAPLSQCAQGKTCSNRGTCNDLAYNQYQCVGCAAGYTGKDCQINVDDCASQSCSNHGRCVDRVNSYTCTCNAGYKGTNCQTSSVTCGQGTRFDQTKNSCTACSGGQYQDKQSHRDTACKQQQLRCNQGQYYALDNQYPLNAAAVCLTCQGALQYQDASNHQTPGCKDCPGGKAADSRHASCVSTTTQATPPPPTPPTTPPTPPPPTTVSTANTADNTDDWFNDDTDDVANTPNQEDAPIADGDDGSPTTGNNSSNSKNDNGGRSSSNTTSDQTTPNANAGGLSGDTASNAGTNTTTTTPDASQSVDDASKNGTSTAVVVAIASVVTVLVLVGLTVAMLVCRKKQSQSLARACEQQQQIHLTPVAAAGEAAPLPASIAVPVQPPNQQHGAPSQQPYGTARSHPAAGDVNWDRQHMHMLQPYGDSEDQTANATNNADVLYDNAEVEAATANTANGGQQSSLDRCQYMQPGPNGQRCKAKAMSDWCPKHGCKTASCPNCKSSRARVCDSCRLNTTENGTGGTYGGGAGKHAGKTCGTYDIGAGGGDGNTDNVLFVPAIGSPGGRTKNRAGTQQGSVYLGFDEVNTESMM